MRAKITYHDSQPRVLSAADWAVKAMAGADMCGPRTEEGNLVHAVDACGRWIDEQDLGHSSVLAILAGVRRVLEKRGYSWAESWRDPEFTAQRNMQLEEARRKVSCRGYLIVDLDPTLNWARYAVGRPDTPHKHLLCALILLCGCRGIELRDPDVTFIDAGDGWCVTSLRHKGGKFMHKAPLLCPFEHLVAAVDRYRSLKLNLANAQNRIDIQELKCPLKEVGDKYLAHFKRKLNPHALRSVYAALAYHREHPDMPLDMQNGVVEEVRAYLGHTGVASAKHYDLIKHSA